MTRKEFNEGILTLVRRNRIFAVLPDDSNELCFYADHDPHRYADHDPNGNKHVGSM